MKASIIKKYFVFAIALLISAISYNIFVRPINLVAGGNSGFAIIINEIFGVNPSVTIFILCFIFMVFSYIYLGIEDTIALVFVAIVYPLFIYFTAPLGSVFKVLDNSILLICVAGGIMSGFSNGIIYKLELNTGGFGIISKILYKKKKMSITMVNLLINFIIVLVGAYLFGFVMILYAFIYLYVSKLVSDKILLGIRKNKMIYIISDEYEEIINFLREDVGVDATIFNIKGEYSGKKMKMIMSIVPTKDYVLVKEGIRAIVKKKPFIFVSDSYEVRCQNVSISNYDGIS